MNWFWLFCASNHPFFGGPKLDASAKDQFKLEMAGKSCMAALLTFQVSAKHHPPKVSEFLFGPNGEIIYGIYGL